MRRILSLPIMAVLFAAPGVAETVTFPQIPEAKIPITELKLTDVAYAAVRKPPGEGPFPAVIFLHGGLGQSPMARLRSGSVNQPAQSRFLAWGYVTVNATRRAIRHDPGDRGVVEDTLTIIDAVKDLPYVDDQSIALYGGSGGGTLALEVASVPNNLAAIVAGEPATIIYMGMLNKSHIDFDASGRPTGDRRWDVNEHGPERVVHRQGSQLHSGQTERSHDAYADPPRRPAQIERLQSRCLHPRNESNGETRDVHNLPR